jgi:hypothetical protein
MLDDLRERLLRDGVKPAVAGRYVAELADHLDDLTEHVPRDVALRLLGSPDVLAEAMLAQPGVRSWTARAPWATLTLGPVLTLLLGCVLPMIVLFLGVRAFAADVDYGRDAYPGTWPQLTLGGLQLFNEHLMPLLAGWAAVALAVRQRAGMGWLLAGAVLTAFVGGGLILEAGWHPGHPANVTFGIGFKLDDPFTTVLGRSLESGVFNLVVILIPYAVLRMRAARTA